MRAALKISDPEVDLRAKLLELDVVQLVVLLLGEHDSDGTAMSLDDH